MVAMWTRDLDSLRQGGVMFVIWGLLMALFGAALLAAPTLTGEVLMTVIGVFVILSGVALVYWAWRMRQLAGVWMAILVPAIALVVFGIVVLVQPNVVSTVLLVIAAVLIILAGTNDIAAALVLARVFRWWWVRLLRGVLLLAAGVSVVFSDISGLAVLGGLVAIWAIMLGLLSIAWGVLAIRS